MNNFKKHELLKLIQGIMENKDCAASAEEIKSNA